MTERSRDIEAWCIKRSRDAEEFGSLGSAPPTARTLGASVRAPIANATRAQDNGDTNHRISDVVKAV